MTAPVRLLPSAESPATRPRRRPSRFGFVAGFRFQVGAMRGQAETYFALVSTPFFATTFVSIMVYANRIDLVPYAVVGPTLMAQWTSSLSFAGEMISEDRENGRLELLVAAPASLPLLVFGRLCAVMLVSVPAFVVSILIAGVGFGHWITIHHLPVFLIATVLTAMATAAGATALSALFVTAPGARIVQNTLTFPMFLLGGVIIPASVLPQGLDVASRLLYLSWGADLMRAALLPEPIENVALHLGMVILLGGLALVFGLHAITRFVRRARALGTLSRE
jgi:ABC-2 type transport system permease protein